MVRGEGIYYEIHQFTAFSFVVIGERGYTEKFISLLPFDSGRQMNSMDERRKEERPRKRSLAKQISTRTQHFRYVGLDYCS